jgi:hypothetical protein
VYGEFNVGSIQPLSFSGIVTVPFDAIVIAVVPVVL